MTVVLCLFSAILTSHATGLVYLSNITDTSWGGYGASGSFGLGQPFRTGVSSGGYSLNSVKLSILGGLGDVSGFTVSLYSNANDLPATLLEVLTGDSDPRAEGLYDYVSSGLILQPNTTYWIAATAAGTTPGTAYFWEITKEQDFVATDGWQIPFGNTFGYYYAGSDEWASFPSSTYGTFKFTISATPAPEPASSVLFALGLGYLASKRPSSKRKLRAS